MKERLPYVTDDFLAEFKNNFSTVYSGYYQNKEKEKIAEIFKKSDIIIKSRLEFEIVDLKLLPDSKKHEDTWEIDFENAITLWESLEIPTSVALSEKMWVALENIYYLDYTIDQLSTVQDANKIDQRIIFTYNAKRSAAINSLSLLWWAVYYTVDENNPDDPYHLTKFFFKYVPRSTKMLWLSSNVISSKSVALGILEGVKELVDSEVIRGGRYGFSNANKIINQIGGVTLMELLTREDIKMIVVENVPEMDKTELV